MEESQAVIEAKHLTKDLLQGDTSVASRSDFKDLSVDEIYQALKLIVNNEKLPERSRKELLVNSWRLHYRVKPPTIEEFLTEEWIGPTARSIYPHVRQILTDFWSPNSQYRHLILATAIGTGKAQPLTSKVYTPDGLKNMGDVRVGDTVCGVESGRTTVTAIHPQGLKEVFEITFKDGSTVRCTEDHLWEVYRWSHSTDNSTFSKKYVKSLREILEVGLTEVRTGRWEYQGKVDNKWRFPCAPMVFNEKSHVISPYLMGVLLGDGGLTHHVTFTSDDQGILDRVEREIPDGVQITSSPKRGTSARTYRVIPDTWRGQHPIREELERLGLMRLKSHEKFIPEEYLYDSLENRIALIQGLMDTDGSASLRKGGIGKRKSSLGIEFSVSNKKLAYQMKWLIESIGGVAGVSTKVTSFKGSKETTHYRVRPAIEDESVLFSLPRKREKILEHRRITPKMFTTARIIQSVESVGVEECQCITISNKDGLYFTDNAVVTHNSFTSMLSSMYVTTHLWAMRDPKKFFGLSQATSIVHLMISFTMEKAQQLLLQPYNQVLLTSPKFHRVKMEEQLNKKQEEEYPDQICWTTAGKMGAMQFYNDVHYVLASDPAKLLGLNVISAIFSEISFFIDRGFGADYIWRLYQDGKNRVYNRFFGKYFSGTTMDSSPNDMEASPIDKWIFGTGDVYKPDSQDGISRNYVVTGPHWKFRPERYPIWNDTERTFPVYRGSGGSPPEIYNSEEEIPEGVNRDEIIDVPIDLKSLFEENLLKNIKDYAGWPSGSQDKLITDYNVIEKMFTKRLRNIYTYIYAPITKSSAGLIWNQIRPKFFVDHGKGFYEFYRAPAELRYIHVDQGETKDQASITAVHPEVYEDGSIIYITDFTIVIDPGLSKINLDAIRLFIEDLRDKGHMRIGIVSFDQYQSSVTRDYLKDRGFSVERLSVERDINPYRLYVSMINSQRLKVGYNIVLKNNIKSLQEIETNSGKRKIDHRKGKTVTDDGGDWNQSMMGINANDCSDSHCGAVFLCVRNFKGVPRYVWAADPIETPPEERTEGFDEAYEATKQNLLKAMNEKYGLIPTNNR